MLKATIETQYLREMIDAITAIVMEFRLHVQEDGIRMRAVDTANVAMVLVALAKEAFKCFEAPPGEMTPAVLGIDANQMKEILKDMPDGLVTLTATGGTEYDLEWTPPGKDWFDSHQYFVKGLEINSIRKDPDPPTIALPATVEILSESLLTALTAISHHSDKVTMILHKEDGMFSVSGEGDTIKVRIQGPAAPVKATAKAIYSMDYLLPMVKAIPKDTPVRILFGPDHPIELAYRIAGVYGEVHFLMAPRIETE